MDWEGDICEEMGRLLADRSAAFTVGQLARLELQVRQRLLLEQERQTWQERHEARMVLGQIGDPPQDRPVDSDTSA